MLAWACQKWFRILNPKHQEIELSWDEDFLHRGRYSMKQQIDSIISSSLTFWLFNFGLKILLTNQITWFFNIIYLQSGLIFSLCFLYNRLASWLWLAGLASDGFWNSVRVSLKVKLFFLVFRMYLGDHNLQKLMDFLGKSHCFFSFQEKIDEWP